MSRSGPDGGDPEWTFDPDKDYDPDEDFETLDDPDDADDPDEESGAAARPAGPPLTDVDGLDRGETLYREAGGSWWVVSIGPVMILLVLILEIIGGGRIHWGVLVIFGIVLVGFSVLQVIAARQHVSMELTETTLRQGTQTIAVADIAEIFPANNGSEPRDWEAARALGELPAVPRRRKGIGLRLTNGRLAQAWARDVDRLRSELSEAVLAAQLGLGPTKKSS